MRRNLPDVIEFPFYKMMQTLGTCSVRHEELEMRNNGSSLPSHTDNASCLADDVSKACWEPRQRGRWKDSCPWSGDIYLGGRCLQISEHCPYRFVSGTVMSVPSTLYMVTHPRGCGNVPTGQHVTTEVMENSEEKARPRWEDGRTLWFVTITCDQTRHKPSG